MGKQEEDEEAMNEMNISTYHLTEQTHHTT